MSLDRSESEGRMHLLAGPGAHGPYRVHVNAMSLWGLVGVVDCQ